MTLHISHAPDTQELARQLINQLREAYAAGTLNLFCPPTVVVPNNSMQSWVRLKLADGLGVTPGLNFVSPDSALWQLLQEQDDREPKPRFLDAVQLQRLILSFLARDEARELDGMAPVWTYVGGERSSDWGQDGHLRLWQLTDKLARFYQDYEIQRPQLIAAWCSGKSGLPESAPETARDTERWQKNLYHALFKAGGWRDRTLPGKLTLPGYWRELVPHERPTAAAPQYWFGTTNLSPLQMEVLCHLAGQRDFYMYLPVARWQGAGEHELLKLWARPTEANIALVEECIDNSRPVQIASAAILPRDTEPAITLLQALQRELTGATATTGALSQDASLQVWACPGKHREVETVYNLILGRLRAKEGLRLTDIAVLVTDMEAYLPYFRETFTRYPDFVHNLVDANAATTSLYSTAVSGLLALPGGSFTRREVFALLSNPCFLAAVDADAGMPQQWLAWARDLGIYFSYDGAMKRELCGEDLQDGEESAWGDVHTWQNGLRRLRLGRVMTASAQAPETERNYHWHGYIPHSDMETSGSTLEDFSFGVELLFQQCRLLTEGEELRAPSQWCQDLGQFLDVCLAIPATAPQEAQVRAAVRASLNTLSALDACFPEGISLDFARNHLLSGLEDLPANFGKPLLEGVTITSLRQGRLLPFREIYVVGLGEGQFPGQEERSTLDLRRALPASTERNLPDQNRQLFLDAVLSASERLILTYSNKDLEKDAELGPCSLISQLKSYLQKHFLAPDQPWREGASPLHGRSPRYLETSLGDERAPLDLLQNFDAHDYWVARQSLQQDPVIPLLELQQGLEMPHGKGAGPTETALHIRDLRAFLINPAEAVLQRRLRLRDEEGGDEAEVEEEPFATEFLKSYQLMVAMMNRYVRTHQSSRHAEAPRVFGALYSDAHMRGQTPDGTFKTLEAGILQEDFLRSIESENGLQAFLESMAGKEFTAVALSSRPSSQTVFPELKLPLEEGEDSGPFVCLCGDHPLVWRDDEALHMLVLTNSKKPDSKKAPCQGLSKHLLGPLLLFLALQSSPPGSDAREYVGSRELMLHVRYRDAFPTLRFAIPPAEARQYLLQLVREVGGSSKFEDLPLKAILGLPWPPTPDTDPAQYAAALQEKIDDSQEGTYGGDSSRMELLDIIEDLAVPEDALNKVQRRLVPLCQWLQPETVEREEKA